jgi:hypothetical protein
MKFKMDSLVLRASHGHHKTPIELFLDSLKLQNGNRMWMKNIENFQSPSSLSEFEGGNLKDF